MINKESSLSIKARIGLAISVLVVLVIIVIAFIVFWRLKKKVLSKYRSLNYEEEKLKLQRINPNFGIILEELKVKSKSSLDDFLVTFLVNNVYLNNFKSIYLSTQDEYLAISLAVLTNRDINFETTETKEYDLQSFGKQVESKINPININNNSKGNFDYLINFDLNKSITEKVEEVLPFLDDQGMMVIDFEKTKEFKESKEFLTQNNLRYETIKFNKNCVILLAKDLLQSTLKE
ncbi:hypothetical protein JN00_0128 [Metamycoplasma subdolum]|uniref:Uncharacterized protein n=1 Tax=Metamycoplasma subdolum TaxID=92407 RepID=A0A3M0A1M0_9BACT|nr:hypothetical protein [Metamycoplasma subdolum]RMA79081.1 hypothetical protein JN00_0128 [Metamycoplasma subdolum]WPB50604.1 hypothetical protein R9C05_00360 [Metamycoplasma subdolum]